MGYPTQIEWTDATWNPVGGCDIESPGCIHCYAQVIAASGRLRNHPLYSGVTKMVKGKPVFNGMLTVLPENHPNWMWPLRWHGAKEPRLGAGEPSLIFVGDMADLFHKGRPIAHIDRAVAPIILSTHIGQLLTKRPDMMANYFGEATTFLRLYAAMGRMRGMAAVPAMMNQFIRFAQDRLWLGFSAERQKEMDERARHMRSLALAGWQIFVSVEPLLERVILPRWFGHMPRKPWVIVGGESGPDARPMHPEWVREVRDHAAELGCPFFFKQWGEYAHEGQLDASDKRLIFPSDAEGYQRIGKKRAGRLLDGREHNAFPGGRMNASAAT